MIFLLQLKKQKRKKTEKQKAEEMEKMFDDDDDDDDDDDEGHETISDILGRIDLAGNDEGRSILSSSSDSPYLKKVEVDVHRSDDQTPSSFDTPCTKKFKIDVHRLDDPSPCKSVSSVSNPKLDKLAVEKHKLLSKSHVSSEDSYVEDKQSTDRMSCNDDNDPGSDLHKDDDNSNKKAQSDESRDKDFSKISGDKYLPNEKNYHCSECPETFYYQTGLDTHTSNAHSKKGPVVVKMKKNLHVHYARRHSFQKED